MATYDLNQLLTIPPAIDGAWTITSTCPNNTVSVVGNLLTYNENLITTECIVNATYTIGNGTCTDVSLHTLTLTPKECPNSIISISSTDNNFRLKLNRLVVDGILQTNYVYKVVKKTLTSTCQTDGIIYVKEGTCSGCTIPNNVSVVTLSNSLTTLDFDVEEGEYEAYICCCASCNLDPCTKIECCKVTTEVELRILCTTPGTTCTPIHFSYDSGTATSYIINIPFLAPKGKCVKFAFNGGFTVADKIELFVDTDNGMQPIKIYPFINSNTFTTERLADLIFRSSELPGSLPLQPYINNLNFTNISSIPIQTNISGIDMYKFVIRVTAANTGGTKWSADLSCCDCLNTCPEKEYFCLTDLVNLTANCNNGCKDYMFTYAHPYTNQQLSNYISGNCITQLGTPTCLQSSNLGQATIYGSYTGSQNGPSYADGAQLFLDLAIPCASNTYFVDEPLSIDYNSTTNTLTLETASGLITDIQNWYNSLTDLSNIYLYIDNFFDACDDNKVNILSSINIPLVINDGISEVIAQFNFINSTTLEISNLYTLNPSGCYNNTTNTSIEPVFNLCSLIIPNSFNINNQSTNIYTGLQKPIIFKKRGLGVDLISFGNSTYGTSNFDNSVCNSLYNTASFILLGPEVDVNGKPTNWIFFTKDLVSNCGLNNYGEILQIGDDVDTSLWPTDCTGTLYYPIPNYYTIIGVKLTTNTKTGINNCYGV